MGGPPFTDEQQYGLVLDDIKRDISKFGKKINSVFFVSPEFIKQFTSGEDSAGKSLSLFALYNTILTLAGVNVAAKEVTPSQVRRFEREGIYVESGKRCIDLDNQMSSLINKPLRDEATPVELLQRDALNLAYRCFMEPKAYWKQKNLKDFSELAHLYPKEDVHVPLNKHTDRQNFQDLLGANKGVFLGSNHNEHATTKLLASRMSDLSANGVGTLYVEFDQKDSYLFDMFNKGFIDAKVLHEKLAMRGGEILFADKKSNSQPAAYETGFFKLFDAARSAGIRVVPHDYTFPDFRKYSLKEQKKLSELRLVEGDPFMASSVLFDIEEQKAGNKNKKEKYIVYGGYSHLEVADYLGIPSVGLYIEDKTCQFMRNNPTMDPAIRKYDPNGHHFDALFEAKNALGLPMKAARNR